MAAPNRRHGGVGLTHDQQERIFEPSVQVRA
jgi:hypothetical protein